MTPQPQPPQVKEAQIPKFTELNNLCSGSNGSRILFATDDWFAAAENLLEDAEAEWKEGLYDDCGKWMDGWETRRKRIPGHDWTIIKLGFPGVIHGVDIDTAHFSGNYSPKASVQVANLTPEEEALIPARRKGKSNGCAASEDDLKQVAKIQSDKWKTVVPKTVLGAGYPATQHNYFPVDNRESWTHIRLNMFPDGGIARLRVYGQVKRPLPDIISSSPAGGLVDLIAMENGGVCIGYSDAHYGHPRNIILPGVPENMSQGWETARRLDRPEILTADANGVLNVPGCEWAAFRLGVKGKVSRLEVNTLHYKGNFPDSIKVEVCSSADSEAAEAQLLQKPGQFKTLLPSQKLGAHKNHVFEKLESVAGDITHVRVSIAPDGGLARIRLWGKPSA